MPLILCGFKGSGKSFLAKAFSLEFSLSFVDSDELLLKYFVPSNMSLSGYYRSVGEALFREKEAMALRRLHTEQNSIIALGGGALLRKDNREFLLNLGTIVYLKWEKQTVMRRLQELPLPAFIDEKSPFDSAEDHFETRAPIFEASAHEILQMEDKTTSQLLENLWQIATSDSSFASQHGESLMALRSDV